MAAKLRVIPVNAESVEVVIGNTMTFGRLRDNEIWLGESRRISRRHAILRRCGANEYQIVDLGSTNGTFLNGQRIIMPVTLKNGDRIRIVTTEIVFEQQHDPGRNPASGENCGIDAAMLVCDMCDFKALSSKMWSGARGEFLGAWFRDAIDIVQRNGGFIDKFLGDAVLAYWRGGEHVANAGASTFSTGVFAGGVPSPCNVALDTATKLLAHASTMQWPGGEPFRVSAALHCGSVIADNPGAEPRRDATISGEPVNTILHLESLAKEFKQRLLFSLDFPLLGELALKGKSQPVRVYGLT
jgi:adenylate cyclase